MNTKEMAAMLLHQRLVHGVILDSCGPDEVEWEAMTGVVNALPPKWRQVIEFYFLRSYPLLLCRPRPLSAVGSEAGRPGASSVVR